MSSSAPLSVSPELLDEWKNATQDSKPYRFLKIQIRDERLVLVEKFAGTLSVAKDFDAMKSPDGPCFFLFRVAGPKNWLLISYVPDHLVKVSSKMVYAASKSSLKSKLGHQFINEEVQFSSPEELSYSSYMNNRAPVNAKSSFEVQKEMAIKNEEDERSSRMAAAGVGKMGGPAHGIGGYHQVKIPLTEDAKAHIAKYQSGVVNLVELKINDKKDSVDVASSASLSAAEVGAALNRAEPRFYLYNYQSIRSPAHSKVNLFVYCCPDVSVAGLRMVYSTSKPQIAQAISDLGIQFAKRLEIRGGDEFTEDFIKNETGAGGPKFGGAVGGGGGGAGGFRGGMSPAKPASFKPKAHAPSAPHPIYSLMAGNSNASAPMKKKIVLPPPGAY